MKTSRQLLCFTVIAPALASGCGLLIGLDQFRDACPEVELGLDCPDAGGGGSSATSTSSAASSSASGSGGAAPVICDAGQTRACYAAPDGTPGPDGTKGVGACKGGQETCSEDGTVWSGCHGAVFPKTETCASTEDEDCNGLECVLSAESWPSTGDDTLRIDAVVTSPTGSVYVAGAIKGSISFGGMQLSDDGGTGAAFVAKLASNGSMIWARTIPNASVSAVAANASDDVFFAGFATIDTTQDANAIASGQFVAQYTATGDAGWARSLGGGGCSPFICGQPKSIAVSSDGFVLLAGNCKTGLDFGDGPAALVGTETNSYVAKVDSVTGAGSKNPTGTVWSTSFPAAVYGNTIYGPFVSGTSDGRARLAFNYKGTVAVGSQSLTSQGAIDIAYADFRDDGTVQTAQTFGDEKNQLLIAAGTGPGDSVILAGAYLGSLTNGTTTITAASSAGADIGFIYGDGFVFVFPDNRPSTPRVFRGFGTAGVVRDVRMGMDGSLTLVGTFSGAADLLGGGSLDGGMGTALLLAKLNPDATVAWQRAYAHPSDGVQLDLVTTTDGASWIYGSAGAWPLNVGTGDLNTSAQPNVAFRAKFAP